MMPDATPADKGFHHLALLYRSSQECLATLLSFARAGLALAEPVFIAVPAPAGDLLRERLAPARGRLVFADMATLYGPPPNVIWLRCGNQPTKAIEKRLRDHADDIAAFLQDGASACWEIY